MNLEFNEEGFIVLKNDQGAYGRRYEACIGEDICSVCDAKAICLSTDGSDGEYGGPSFCVSCLNKVIEYITAAQKLEDEIHSEDTKGESE